MKIYCKEITLNTDKDVKDTSIVCISDLHYSKKLNKKTLPYLYSEICACHPDYICFLGDLLNDNSFEDVYLYITYLSYIAPVLLIDGNHDIKSFKVNDRIHENKNHILSDELKSLLDNISNVYYLNNNRTEQFGNITFTGADFYHHSHEDENIEFFNENLPEMKEDTFNILMCHSPYFVKKEVIDKLDPIYQNTDAAFTGHIHNALMPAYIDNAIKTNIGLFTVDEGLFPSDYLGEKEIIISEDKKLTRINVPPIRTFNGDNLLVSAANKFYPPSMRLIKIKKN